MTERFYRIAIFTNLLGAIAVLLSIYNDFHPNTFLFNQSQGFYFRTGVLTISQIACLFALIYFFKKKLWITFSTLGVMVLFEMILYYELNFELSADYSDENFQWYFLIAKVYNLVVILYGILLVINKTKVSAFLRINGVILIIISIIGMIVNYYLTNYIFDQMILTLAEIGGYLSVISAVFFVLHLNAERLLLDKTHSELLDA